MTVVPSIDPTISTLNSPASWVSASSRASGRPPESLASIIPAKIDGSTPMAWNKGETTGPSPRAISGASTINPAITSSSRPQVTIPSSNSLPSPKRPPSR